MYIHITGVCSTFMVGIARIARELGHSVSGSDDTFFSPLSDQLAELGVELRRGYRADNLKPAPDLVIVGSTVARGNGEVEALLDSRLPYTSGAQWLSETVLRDRWVLAVAGTHGKTATSSMLAWLLEHAGLKPGFLIGGVAGNFSVSARLGEAPFFVVEEDAYDAAFFERRSNFLHYRPNTLVLTNLEFDPTDTFDDVAAVKRRFCHLLHCVPSKGKVFNNADAAALSDVIEQGCWSETESFAGNNPADWRLSEAHSESTIDFEFGGDKHQVQSWQMVGQHNALNAVAAIAAARHAGVTTQHSLEAMCQYIGIKW